MTTEIALDGAENDPLDTLDSGYKVSVDSEFTGTVGLMFSGANFRDRFRAILELVSFLVSKEMCAWHRYKYFNFTPMLSRLQKSRNRGSLSVYNHAKRGIVS